MLIRSDYGEAVREILQPYVHEIQGELEEAIYLIEDDNLIIFEKMSDKIFRGHYFFNSARGRRAISICKEGLEKIFQEAEAVQGLTPVDKKAACLMSRWLGFTSYGIIEAVNGPMELFILTKQEWRKLNG